MAPHGRHNRVDFFAFEAAKRDAQVLTVGQERERALVHVQAHHEIVGHDERLVGLERFGIDWWRLIRRLRVVAGSIAAQVPAPRFAVAADQRLIANAVQRRFVRADADDGVRAPLSRVPLELPQVNALGVAVFGANAVGRLSHRVSMQCERVGLFDEYVERTIVRIPRMQHLGLEAARGHVEQVLESTRHLAVGQERRVVVVVGYGAGRR